MTPFTKDVIALIKKIPRGQVATYGQIATLAGKPHGARGVSWILSSCSKAYKLPWQRVINSQGRISFPRDSREYRNQKRLLMREGIPFSEDDSVLLKKHGWKKSPSRKKRPSRSPQLFS